MEQARVCIAMANTKELDSIASFLNQNGYVVLDRSSNGTHAMRRIRAVSPDIILCDYMLPGLNGVEIARLAEQDQIAPSVIICHDDTSAGSMYMQPKISDYAYIVRPITKAALLQSLRLVLINYKKVMSLNSEIEKLKSKLESRKIIEKAKGILITKLGIDEETAYREMQKQSMDTGFSMKKISESIISNYEMEKRLTENK